MSGNIRTAVGRLPRKELAVAAVGVLVLLSVVALRLSGGAAAQEDTQTATAQTGNVVVTVRGVGRVESTSPSIQVFPRVSGQVARLAVQRGDQVVAGQLIAVLDDGGASVAGVDQAVADLGTARIDVRQRRSSRNADITAARLDLKRAQADYETLLGGTPAARKRAIGLAKRNVRVAEERLAQLQAPPSASAVRAAEAEVTRAEAALATLLKPVQGPAPEVMAAAQQAVVVARQNLARAQATGTPADVSAAQLELYRAQAELAALQKPPAEPLPEEVAAARAAVTSARANLDKLYAPPAAADVQSARLDLQRAQSDLRQLQAGPSAAARASALAAVKSARSRLEQVKSRLGLDLAREGVAGAQARLDGARATEGLLTIRAPASGEVTSVNVTQGSAVDTTAPIATIAASGRLIVTVDLSEFDVAQVKLGQKATVSVDALGGESYPGTVVFVAPSGNNNGGVVTFPVQLALRGAEEVKPAMSVSASILVARAVGVVTVPLEAVTYDDEDQATVTLVGADGQQTVQDVTVGLTNTSKAEIVKGLEAGQQVVLTQVQQPSGEEE